MVSFILLFILCLLYFLESSFSSLLVLLLMWLLQVGCKCIVIVLFSIHLRLLVELLLLLLLLLLWRLVLSSECISLVLQEDLLLLGEGELLILSRHGELVRGLLVDCGGATLQELLGDQARVVSD